MGERVSFRGRVPLGRYETGRPRCRDIPADLVALWRTPPVPRRGTLNGAPFGGSTMLVAGGGFAVGVSKASLRQRARCRRRCG